MSNAPVNVSAAPRVFPTAPAAGWLPASGVRRMAAGAGLALSFAGLTFLGAHIVIPIEPVPITMQTLFVLLAGASIGAGWGALSQWIYVALGAAGLPLFAAGAAGPGVIAGPTGGYILAFLIVPWLVGRMLQRSNRIGWQVFSFTAGTVVLLAMGVAHLALFYTHDLGRALVLGALPFLFGDALKIVAAVSIHRSSQALVHHYRSRR